MKGQSEKKAQAILEERFGDKYLQIKTNVSYPGGEIDFMGERADEKWDIYEIKSTNRKKLLEKAEIQLDRARQYIEEHCGEFCGDLFTYISREDTILPKINN